MKENELVILVFITLCCITFSCNTTKDKQLNHTTKNKQKPNSKTWEKKNRKKKVKKVKKVKTTKKVKKRRLSHQHKEEDSKKIKKHCEYLDKFFQPEVERLLSFQKKELPERNSYYKPYYLSYEDCLNLKPNELIKIIKPLKKTAKKKIALVLPLSGESMENGLTILNGIKSYCKLHNIDFDENYLLYDNKGSFERAQKIYSTVILNNNFSLIMGGVTTKETHFLSTISKNLRIPTLVFNRSLINITQNPYIFQLLPSDYYLGEALAYKCHQKNIKKVAIFEPTDNHAKQIIVALTEELAKYEINVTQIIPYQSGDFPSMNEAVIKLAQLDSLERKKVLFGKLSEDPNSFEDPSSSTLSYSHTSNKILGLNSIELEPLVEAEALFIPDNFRIIKHFIKLFHFHNIDKLVLFGNQQWRSDGLIKPWENFLDDAFFVDYIGNYQKIPSVLNVVNSEPYLATPENITKIDLLLIGFYSAKIALATQHNSKIKFRHDLTKKLHTISSKKIFEHTGNPYSTTKGFHWPSYTFTLKDQKIYLNAPEQTNNGL